MDLTVGASRIASLGPAGSSVGYNTSVSLSRNSFSVSYTQATGQQSGVGSTSDTRIVGATINRTFGDADLSLNVSGFEARPRFDNPFSNRGLTAGAAIGLGDASLSLNVSESKTEGNIDDSFNNRGVAAIATIGLRITDTMSIQGGGQFQRNTPASGLGFTQKRVFVSLSFSDPNLWRILR